MKKKFIFLCIILNFFSLFYSYSYLDLKERSGYRVVFVHGTHGMSFSDAMKFIFYKLFSRNKFYNLLDNLIDKRFNKCIDDHTSLCNNDLGLHKISNMNISLSIYFSFNKYIYSPVKDIFKLNNIDYYMFNWTGLLLDGERSYAALLLYYELKTLLKKDPQSKIILVGYSHGGNIILKLAEIVKSMNDDKFFVDLVILLAVPLNNKSNFNASSSLFGSIFNFYSSSDILQVADFFSGFPFVTLNRKLNANKNIWNIEVKYIVSKNKAKRKASKKFNIGIRHKYFGNFLNGECPSFLLFLVPVMYKLLQHQFPHNLLLKIDLSNKIEDLKQKIIFNSI